jgi:hypothetical protein
MGVLAQAKNGAEQFWKIEISCRQWESSACTQIALIFFFKFGGGGEERMFSIFLCSQHVPFKFPLGSHQVPYVFPNIVPNSTSL